MKKYQTKINWKKVIQEEGRTLKWTAKKIGVHQTSLTQYLSGKLRITWEVDNALKELYNESKIYYLDEE